MKLKEIPLSIYHSYRLNRLSMNKLKQGIASTVPVIVSLTSIPSRLHTLHLVIRSLLDQNVLPTKIVLWLHSNLKNTIPDKLARLEEGIFEIGFSEMTCSHRKLVHSLDVFPNQIIVTCDDDLLYRKDWLQLFYEAHLKNKTAILANQTRYISYDTAGKLLPYTKWSFTENKKFNQKAVLPIGAGGVLYPPNCLDQNTTNSELFLKLTPKADDLWFKAMSLLNGTDSYLLKKKPKSPIPIIGSQKQSLKKSNIGEDKNRTQWSAVSNYFEIDINAE